MKSLRLILAVLFTATLAFCDGFSNPSSGVSVTGPLNSSGAVQTSYENFLVEVAKGNVPGHSIVNKYGHNGSAEAGDDVWSGDGAYAFFPTNGQAVWAQSTSAADDIASTGCYSVIFYGLNSSWALANETVELDGTTPVALTNTYLRMFRGICLAVQGAESNVGTITVTNSAGTVAINIAAGDGQTQQAIYTVPEDHRALFIKGYVGLANSDKNGQGGSFVQQMRVNNGASGAWQTKGQIGLLNIAQSYWQYSYGAPAGPIPERTDIRLRLKTAEATMDTVGGFDLLLIEDGY